MAALLLLAVVTAQAKTLSFSGYEWEVRLQTNSGPGPNDWSPGNVWVDTNGWLHLKLAKKNGAWSCAEIFTTQRLGFGTYRFEVSGPIDRLDPNVVLGLFNYPDETAGPDGTHEIDIEFARWGRATSPNGNYTVWPAKAGLKPAENVFEYKLPEADSIQQFTWSRGRVLFTSSPGSSWACEPKTDAAGRISQKPMPVHLNLWLFKGKPPLDQKEVEIVIKSFVFAPL
jgi:hypothetical protein